MKLPGRTSSGQARIAFRPVAGLRVGKQPTLRRLPGTYFLDVLCFIIPLASFITVKIIGVLPTSELLTLAMVVPCIVWRWKRIWRGYNKTILTLMGLWLLSQIFTDFYRESPFINMAKGQSGIAFFGIDLIVLSALAYKRERRILLFAIGSMLSPMLNYYVRGYSGGADVGQWKFGYAPFVIPAVMLISCLFYFRRNYFVAEACIFGLAAYNLLQNFRSPALILVPAGILVLPIFSVRTVRPSSQNLHRAPSPLATPRSAVNMRVLILFAMIGVSAFAVGKLYAYLASSGTLGDEAQEKYTSQSRGTYGILGGGRPEGLVSWQAVLDSPILGHGSWAEEPKYSEMLLDIIQETGYEEGDYTHGRIQEAYVIPTHSYLMGAWVFSGVLGAVFWIYICYLAVSTLRFINAQTFMAPYIAYVIFDFLWSIWFSPFGQGVRLNAAFVIIILCTLLEHAPSRQVERRGQDGRNRRSRFPAIGRMPPRITSARRDSLGRRPCSSRT